MKKDQLTRLISREELDSIVKELAARISRDYGKKELVLVCILKGAFMFLSDLIRHLQIPVQVDFVRLASYRSGMKTSGIIEITKDIELPVEGKDVLIVEDIVDSGRTLQFLKDRLALSKPDSVKVCALLDKKARREVEIEAEYLGKEVDDVFVVGYGIDFNEDYRYLPEVYYVTPVDP
ncbi:MAG: hypoxanthine phosphoribosyltransferase [Deltaproteobacteria bacterium RBG_16_50_11]|nr:MAG: hypoxanthine phosphoribosyltransferase [Deltaproteobacteria bacterium RBG_16_50_11]